MVAANGGRNIDADRNILVEARLFDPAAIANAQITEIMANAGVTVDDPARASLS